MIALGGPAPSGDTRVPTDMGIMEILAAPRYPVWPWTTRRMRRKIGWVFWEQHGVRVEQRAMVYARTDEQ